MRYKMELEERSSSSDAGRDHLDASAARFLTANAGLRLHMDEGFKERSPHSDRHQLHQHMGSELSAPRRFKLIYAGWTRLELNTEAQAGRTPGTRFGHRLVSLVQAPRGDR